MPLRALVILIAVALIVMAVRGLWRSSRTADSRGEKTARMVQCAHCGVYIPENEAHTSEGRFYCSADHLKDAADTKHR
ncbi:MAG TPA: PP0621 family protein [Gammaproteobacteria bacterium]|nr:PP0621 family protein [Gammaproteobacteria bacterium]